jgi:uncharacterized protein YndB with AHSA1/START domain
MKKRAEISLTYTYSYRIEDVFRIITESIITQMSGKDKTHNLNNKNPLGKTSDYFITHGKRQLAVHFEITAYEHPTKFTYITTYNNTTTEQTWLLKSIDKTTTHATYTERATNTSILNKLLLLFNKKQFNTTARTYFERIEAALEQTARAPRARATKTTTTTNAPSYKDMNIKHLKELAKKQQIKLPENAKKTQIIKLLKSNQNNEQNKKAG